MAARDEMFRIVRNALFDDQTIGDPDDLDYHTNAVVDALLKPNPEQRRAGFLIVGGKVHAVEAAYNRGPSGEEKESDRWDLYTEHQR